MKDSIALTIPSKPEYISVVRLTASSIASGMGMNIDEIDDIKVCIAEACNNAMTDQDFIDIEFLIKDQELAIKVKNVRENHTKENKAIALGLLIIRSLMDQVVFTQEGVEMSKFTEVDQI